MNLDRLAKCRGAHTHTRLCRKECPGTVASQPHSSLLFGRVQILSSFIVRFSTSVHHIEIFIFELEPCDRGVFGSRKPQLFLRLQRESERNGGFCSVGWPSCVLAASRSSVPGSISPLYASCVTVMAAFLVFGHTFLVSHSYWQGLD